MRNAVKVQAIGNGLGIEIPPEIVERMEEGDELFVVLRHDGVLFTKGRERAAVMEAFDVIPEEHRETLDAPADS